MPGNNYLGMSGEEWLIGLIRRRLEDNLNWLMINIGQPGTGKSWAGLRIATLVDPSFDPTTGVVFTLEQFLDRINQGIPPGSVILFDESGIDLGARAAMSKINKAFQALIESSRFLRLCVIFTVPSLAFIDLTARRLAHIILETEGVSKEDCTVSVKPFFVSGGSRGEEFLVYPRLHTPEGPIRLVGISLGRPPATVTEAYEAMRESHMRQVYLDLAASLKKDREEEEDRPPRDNKKRAVIEELLAHPEESASSIARRMGVSDGYARQLRLRFG
jgi:hypothetical protein